MENYFNQKSLFYVIPENIEFSSVFKFLEFDDDNIVLKNENLPFNAKEQESVEIFSNNESGILYFKSYVKSYKNELLIITRPVEIEILQRRESERVLINEIIDLINPDNTVNQARIIDLSVGGIKLSTNKQLSINQEYKSILNFDNLNLEFTFLPTRIASDENNSAEYITSGQIFLKSPKDKIELVQYCYKKQFEQNSRG